MKLLPARRRCLSAAQSGLPAGPGGVLEVAAADLTQRRTLQPGMFAGVRQLVSCGAVKVQPKEGDTPDRAKYYQGEAGGGGEGVWRGAC
jgi:hypothetical protein